MPSPLPRRSTARRGPRTAQSSARPSTLEPRAASRQNFVRHVALRLLRNGEDVADVPPKLSARARVFATGHGRKTDATDAHSVALVGCRFGTRWASTGHADVRPDRMLCHRFGVSQLVHPHRPFHRAGLTRHPGLRHCQHHRRSLPCPLGFRLRGAAGRSWPAMCRAWLVGGDFASVVGSTGRGPARRWSAGRVGAADDGQRGLHRSDQPVPR